MVISACGRTAATTHRNHAALAPQTAIIARHRPASGCRATGRTRRPGARRDRAGRRVWGTDWPYVAPPGPAPTARDHHTVLETWLPDPELRQRVLVDNPARLYGWTDNV
jgi:hypothetical protein